MADKPKRNILPLVIVAVAILIIIIGFIYFSLTGLLNSLKNGGHGVSFGNIKISAVPVATGVATYDNAKLVVPYTVIKYAVVNALNASLTFGVYPRNPLPNIYFLNTTDYCYQCYDQNAVLANLSAYIVKYGLVTNQTKFSVINQSQLSKLPIGSMIIVVSGLIPAYMLPASPFSENGATITTLINKGDIIIYVGDNFSRSIGADGTVFQSSNSTNAGLNAAGLPFTPGFANKNLSKQLLKLNLSTPTFKFYLGGVYGTATYINLVNTSSVIALGNTPTSGWTDAKSLASDIAKVINQHFWIKPLAINSYFTNTGQFANGTVGIIDFNTSIVNNMSMNPQKRVNVSFPLLTVLAYNSTSFSEKNVPFKIVFGMNGTISMPKLVGQAQQTSISLTITSNPNKTQKIIPNIQVYNSNLSLVESISVSFFNNTNLSVIKYSTFSIPSGSYIAVLRDYSNRYYGSAVFNIAQLTIVPVGLNFKGDVFSFKLSSNGQPVTGAPYTITLNGGYKYNRTCRARRRHKLYYTKGYRDRIRRRGIQHYDIQYRIHLQHKQHTAGVPHTKHRHRGDNRCGIDAYP